MIIALAQQNYRIGDFDFNFKKMLQCIHRAERDGADLIIFSELALCGYPPLDFLEHKHFVEQCQWQMHQLAFHCTKLAAIVGGPSINPAPEGKNLFNSAWFLAEGKVQKIFHKTLLPNYDVFDEYRYFESGPAQKVLHWKGERIAVTICEDLWDIEEDPMYRQQPMAALAQQQPDWILNIAASPFQYKHVENRKRVLQENARRYHLPVVYVNAVGAQNELIFDGGSMLLNAQGQVIHELQYFQEDYRLYDTQTLRTAKAASFGLSLPETAIDEIYLERIHKALVLGIRDYFSKMDFQQAILGLSGGIDSALVYALAVEALGKDNVLAVLLPSPYSSEHSISDALQLVENLNGKQHIIPIDKPYNAFLDILAPYFDGLPFSVAEENIQSRCRAVLLMALANKMGYILLNTSNKSEAAVGYGTLYGDMCGGISVIGDVYKTKVFALCKLINKDDEVIPESILTKAPSAELRPNQKDSDSLPPYHILDGILELYIEGRSKPSEIIDAGFDKQTVEKVLDLVNRNEWKRYQTPPILRVSSKAFGLGRRMPLVAKYLSA